MVALGHSNEQVERETQVRHEMGRCNKLVDELSAVVGNIIASLSSVLASAQPPDKNLKDDSCEANFVPQWQKESAIKGVEFHIACEIASIGRNIDNSIDRLKDCIKRIEL